MKIVSLIAFITLASVAFSGTVTLKVSGTAGLKGTAKVTNELLADGTKKSMMEMSLRNNKGQSVTVIQMSEYEATGIPKQKKQTTIVEGKTEAEIVALYSAGVVVIQLTAGGKTQQSTIPFPLNSSVAEKFEFWFVRDTIPFKGVSSFSRLDLSTLTFEKTRAVNLGTRTIRIGRKKVKAHLVEVDDSKIYLDDNGDPYKIISPGVTMERTR